jgi:hypothetical protein
MAAQSATTLFCMPASGKRWATLFAATIALGVAGPAGQAGASPSNAEGGRLNEKQLTQIEGETLGPEHAAEHAALRRATDIEIRRWNAMSPAERRQARDRRLTYDAAARSASVNSAEDFPPQSFGQWTTAPFQLCPDCGTGPEAHKGYYAIHAALLPPTPAAPTGEVIFWGYPPDLGSGKPNSGEAALWDPADGTGSSAFTSLTNTLPIVDPDGPNGPEPAARAPIYCVGESFLPDGELLIAGGNKEWPYTDLYDKWTSYAGLKLVFTFNPWTNQWTKQPQMQNGRWYPSEVELADGRQVFVGGYTGQAPGGEPTNDIEVFDPGQGLGSRGSLTLKKHAARSTANYPHLFTLPNGNVLLAGPGSGDSGILDTKGFTWRDLPAPHVSRIGGNAVLVPGGPNGSWKVMQIDGVLEGRDKTNAQRSTETIDAKRHHPRWRWSSDQNVSRSWPNTVLLPDGSMVTVGGGNGIDRTYGNYRTSSDGLRRHVELYDPATGKWSLGPPQQEDRTYHSVGLLLPDGRVWSAGDDRYPEIVFGDGSRGFSQSDTGEIYSPPYLFGSNGQPLSAAQRPQIVSAPGALSYGHAFSVTTAGPKPGSAVLVAPSAVTHGADMHQRLVRLDTTSTGATSIGLKAPPSGKVAPPGYYMLFVLDARGTPSVAHWVQVR